MIMIPLPSPEEEYITATWTALNKKLQRRGIQPIVLAGGQEYYFAKVSSGLSLHVLPTDGTNTMPMLDARTRPGFVKLTDGTSEATIINSTLKASVYDAFGKACYMADWNTIDIAGSSNSLLVTALLQAFDGTQYRMVGLDDSTNRNLYITPRVGADAFVVDTDDNDIAYSQKPQVVIALNYVSDGSKWVRMTQP